MFSLGFKPIIGLEIHAQLLTKSKLFCSCERKFKAPPNSLTCPVCLGLPGALPVLNQKAVEMGIKFALAVKSCIQKRSVFERKNYFYPDLPKGYQITQNRWPLAKGGFLKIKQKNQDKKISIEQIHLEEDSGKSIHAPGSEEKTYLDFNRCGIPLLEIVTKPEMSCPEEAVHFLKKVIITLQYLDIGSGNMERGSLRCDANVSVQKKGSQKKGIRAEIKNLNSFSFLHKALRYELNRHRNRIKKGLPLDQETRAWDEKKHKTVLMRTKERIKDYRYFPDPDLPPLVVTDKDKSQVKKSLPESPHEKTNRFIHEYQIPYDEAETLVSSRETADYFEQTVHFSQAPSETSHWILRDILNYLKETHSSISEFPIRAKELGELIRLIEKNEISRQTAKETVFHQMIRTGQKASDIIKEKNLSRISDKNQLKKIILKVLDNNKDQTHQYLEGKKQVFKYLIGQVMKQTKGKADPEMTNKLLLDILDRYNKMTS